MSDFLNVPLDAEARKKYHQLFMENWGLDLQADMLMEEAIELALAVRRWRRGKGSAEQVRDEMADVQVMIDQLRILDDLDNGFQGIYDFKLRRTLAKLAKATPNPGVSDCSCFQGVLCFAHEPKPRTYREEE